MATQSRLTPASTLPIADCLAGFHHPDGRPDLCVPDVAPAMVPTLDPSACIGLTVILLVMAARKLWRRV
jgi:hypothetical protein